MHRLPDEGAFFSKCNPMAGMNHPEKQCHQTTPKQTCCDEPCSHKVSACLPRGLRQRRVLRCTLAVQLARLPRRPEVLRGERHIDVLADTVPVGKGVCQANGVGGEGGRWPGRKGPHQGSAPPPGTKRLVQTRKGGVGSVRKNPASQRGTCRFCFFDCASVKQGDTPPAPPPPTRGPCHGNNLSAPCGSVTSCRNSAASLVRGQRKPSRSK